MAREFGVGFLGSVPIDPAFVRLVEEGVRPRYPEGTVVEGRSIGERGGEEKEEDREGLLVDKYRDCSLAVGFEGIVRRLVEDVRSGD